MADEKNLLTMEEAINLLSTTRGTLNRWLRSGQITGFKVGRQWRFAETEINRFLKGDEPSIELPASPKALITSLKDAIGETVDDDEEDWSVTRIVNLMLICGLKKGAQNLFVDATEQESREFSGVFSLRIDGIIRRICDYDLRLHSHIVDRLKQLAEMDVRLKNTLPQDGRIRYKIAPDRVIDFILSTVPALSGESCSLSIRDPMVAQVSFEAQGLTGKNLERTQTALSRKQGLYIATGPAGSGKTVMTYTLLNTLNTPENRVMTIEAGAPQIVLTGIVQTNINNQASLGVKELIRAASRQHWDILYVNEIPDALTLSLLMSEALTGKLIAQMHFSSAVSALLKIRDWWADGLSWEDSLALITAQRLTRRLCVKCREPESPSVDDQEFINRIVSQHSAKPPESTYYKATGCKDCHDGYLGRIALFETLPMSREMEQKLNQGDGYEELLQCAISQGMETLGFDGIRKAAKGITSLREVRRVTSDLQYQGGESLYAEPSGQ